MAKKIEGYIKLQISAGKANPSPPVGPALGQRGINIMEFCKAFNAETQKMEQGVPVPTTITVYADKSFSFETKTPPTSYFLIKASKKKKGGSNPGLESIGKITKAQVEEIAREKLNDLNCVDIEAAIRQVEGTARSMGLEVES